MAKRVTKLALCTCTLQSAYLSWPLLSLSGVLSRFSRGVKKARILRKQKKTPVQYSSQTLDVFPPTSANTWSFSRIRFEDWAAFNITHQPIKFYRNELLINLSPQNPDCLRQKRKYSAHHTFISTAQCTTVYLTTPHTNRVISALCTW